MQPYVVLRIAGGGRGLHGTGLGNSCTVNVRSDALGLRDASPRRQVRGFLSSIRPPGWPAPQLDVRSDFSISNERVTPQVSPARYLAQADDAAAGAPASAPGATPTPSASPAVTPDPTGPWQEIK